MMVHSLICCIIPAMKLPTDSHTEPITMTEVGLSDEGYIAGSLLQ